jgi:hypothetical protein
MAKRLTDTDKWNKPWYRKLKSKYKVAWEYLRDKCDHAGFIKIDAEIISIDTNEKFTNEEILNVFSTKLIQIKDNLFWIPKFIEFQYTKKSMISGLILYNKISSGENLKRNAQVSIIELLKKNSIVWCYDDNDKFVYNINMNIGAIQPPVRGAKEKAMVLVKVLDKEEYIISKNVQKHKYGETEFEEVLKKYPNRDGRKLALKYFMSSVKTEDDFNKIKIALKNYLQSEKVKKGYIKNASTWFNNWTDWIDIGKKNKQDSMPIFDDSIPAGVNSATILS